MTSLIFDTETTGLPLHPSAKASLQPRIIEWAGILVDEEGTELDSYEVLINPGIPLPAVITKITGLKDEDLADAASFDAVAPRIQELFAKADQLIAHNLPFDSTMMKNELNRFNLLEGWAWPRLMLCTVQEHAEMWGRRPKLTELYEHYMGAPLAQTHRALDDVRALRDVCVASGVLK